MFNLSSTFDVWDHSTMSATVYSVVTAKGQVTLPARWRRKLGLAPGQRVAMREIDGAIVVDPPPDLAAWRARAKAAMQAAGTWGTSVEPAGAWATAAASKLDVLDG